MTMYVGFVYNEHWTPCGETRQCEDREKAFGRLMRLFRKRNATFYVLREWKDGVWRNVEMNFAS